MGSRYGNRDNERGSRGGEGRGEYRASFERGGFRDTDFGGRSDYGSEENYFGSGRQQFGGGYSGTGRTSRDMAEWTGDYGRGAADRGFGGQSGDRGGSDRGSYESGSRGMSGNRGDYGRDRENYSYDNDEDYYTGPAGGMIGGGLGGYTGGGYQGYTGEQSRGRSQGGWSGYGGGNYGRGEYGSGRDYDRESYGRGSDRGRGGEDRGFFEKIGDEVSSWFGGDETNQGRSHRGRGPRNYSRSDDRIKEDINDRLTDNHYIDASDIEVEVNNGEIILTGTVDSRYAKRMAEDIAEDVSGVKNVENRIRVSREWGQQGSGYGQTTSGSTGTMGSTTGATNAGDADLAAGSGTSGRTGTSGAVTGTENTAGTSGTSGSTGTSGGSSGRGRGRSAGA